MKTITLKLRLPEPKYEFLREAAATVGITPPEFASWILRDVIEEMEVIALVDDSVTPITPLTPRQNSQR